MVSLVNAFSARRYLIRVSLDTTAEQQIREEKWGMHFAAANPEGPAPTMAIVFARMYVMMLNINEASTRSRLKC